MLLAIFVIAAYYWSPPTSGLWDGQPRPPGVPLGAHAQEGFLLSRSHSTHGVRPTLLRDAHALWTNLESLGSHWVVGCPSSTSEIFMGCSWDPYLLKIVMHISAQLSDGGNHPSYICICTCSNHTYTPLYHIISTGHKGLCSHCFYFHDHDSDGTAKCFARCQTP